jgi:hypothetical protein
MKTFTEKRTRRDRARKRAIDESLADAFRICDRLLRLGRLTEGEALEAGAWAIAVAAKLIHEGDSTAILAGLDVMEATSASRRRFNSAQQGGTST